MEQVYIRQLSLFLPDNLLALIQCMLAHLTLLQVKLPVQLRGVAVQLRQTGGVGGDGGGGQSGGGDGVPPHALTVRHGVRPPPHGPPSPHHPPPPPPHASRRQRLLRLCMSATPVVDVDVQDAVVFDPVCVVIW